MDVDYSHSRAEDRPVETAADFFKRAAGNASREDLRAFPASASGVPPEPGDEISLPYSRHAETLVGARVMARARRPSKRQPELEQFFMPPDISLRQTPLQATGDTRRTGDYACRRSRNASRRRRAYASCAARRLPLFAVSRSTRCHAASRTRWLGSAKEIDSTHDRSPT